MKASLYDSSQYSYVANVATPLLGHKRSGAKDESRELGHTTHSNPQHERMFEGQKEEQSKNIGPTSTKELQAELHSDSSVQVIVLFCVQYELLHFKAYSAADH